VAQSADVRSRDEHEFWERRFDDADGAVPGEPIPEPVIGRGAERRARVAARRSGDGTDRDLPGGSASFPPRQPEEPRTVPRPLVPEPDTGWRGAIEWLRDRRGDPRLAVVALVVVAVLAGFVWYRIGLGRSDGTPPRAVRASSSAAASPVATSAGATTLSPDATHDEPKTPLVVHVAGAVVRPGVVEVPHAARVIDALEAVGGATADADLDRLNLAAPVVDGSRVYVPRHGEADPGVLGSSGSAGGGGAPTAAGTTGAKVNLNTATVEQLDALPGIGATYAQAIVDERTRRGGFHSVNELREVRGIGDKRFADLAPLVTV